MKMSRVLPQNILGIASRAGYHGSLSHVCNSFSVEEDHKGANELDNIFNNIVDRNAPKAASAKRSEVSTQGSCK